MPKTAPHIIFLLHTYFTVKSERLQGTSKKCGSTAHAQSSQGYYQHPHFAANGTNSTRFGAQGRKICLKTM